MTDQPTLNRAAQVLRMVTPDRPADEALRITMAEHKHWSPHERRAIVRAVFSYFRWLGWFEGNEPLQRQVEMALKLQDRFDANPKNIKKEALAVRAVPEWLRAEIAEADLNGDFLRQLQREPALWLRPRLSKESFVERELEDAHCVEIVLPPEGLRFNAIRYNGTRDLYRQQSFQEGLFEIQDLASQWVGYVCAPGPGETWWDACAGQGGKTLHLADLMQGKGLIWASDRSAGRLEKLKARASRAEVFNYRTAVWGGTEKLPTKTPFDGILLDAPCSGVGTWQRNPHARWTTTPDDVKELAAVQLRLLGNVVGSLKSGGRLIYSVCTLTRSETTDVVSAFSAAHPELSPVFSSFLWPQERDSNGMFIAEWKKS